MIFKKSIFALAMMSALAFGAAAETSVVYSPAFSSEALSQWGNKVAEDYDVAIFINDPALVGKKITAITAPLAASGCNSPKVWLSSKLKLEKGKNVVDIASKEASFKGNDITATLDEPYTITEAGVYVGYSFNCSFADVEPVTVVERACPGSLWIHTSRRQMSWKDQSEKLGLCSALRITLEGDFPASAINVVALPDVVQGDTDSFSVNASIANAGSSPVSSFDYVVTSDAGEFSNSYAFKTPVNLNYLDCVNVELPLGEFSRVGDNPYTLTVTKVNGVENVSDKRSARGHVHITSYNPVCRPLLEEYTQFGCGYCVRGAAALERMYKLYPNDFVGVAYHNADDITITNIYPNKFQGYPTAFMNREEKCDPYFGRLTGGFYIEDMWKEYQQRTVPMGIEVKANWADAEKTQVNVESSTIFARSADRRYSVSYLLLADGLQDWTWIQSNYYAGNSPAGFIEEMMPFLTGNNHIAGMVYNDVVVMTSDYMGEPNSVPLNPEINVENKHQYIFDTTKAKSLNNPSVNMIPNKDALRVVAMVVDESGKVINCNVAKVGTTGIDAPVAEADVVAVEYYTLQGVRSMRPLPGIYVRVERLSDGSTRSSRVAIPN